MMNHHFVYRPHSAEIPAQNLAETMPSIFYDPESQVVASKPGWIELFFRQQCLRVLRKIETGCIQLCDANGEHTIGDPDSDLKCKIVITSNKTYTQIALGGSNGAAQAYIDGLWVVDDLSKLIRIFVRNQAVLDRLESGMATALQSIYQVWNWTRKNTKSGSRRNIAAHYDLGNEFFRLFLDERMMYSSALYQPGDDLEGASVRKLERICETLKLEEKDHLLEIGTGWGGLACYAARTRGCRVTTITISQEQYDEAIAKVKNENLDYLVSVRLQDYREVSGLFDKIVSIEMIEAIGHQYLDTYFAQINTLLKPAGKALIQAIVIDDSRYQKALKSVDFIKRYIFPGGFLPSYSVTTSAAGKQKLMLEDMLDMGLSYAQTLRDWRRRFYAQIEEVAQQGYRPDFQRMWEFYFCYCEGAFDERAISVGQLLFRKQPH